MSKCLFVSLHLLIYGLNFAVNARSKAHGLKRASADARLLELWDRILPGHGCLSLMNVVCYHVEVSPLV